MTTQDLICKTVGCTSVFARVWAWPTRVCLAVHDYINRPGTRVPEPGECRDLDVEVFVPKKEN